MKARTTLHRTNPAHSRLRSTLIAAGKRGSGAEVKRILVPIDFSDCSRAALQYAVTLAQPLNASLVLLYVAETSPAGSEFCASQLPELEADLRRMAQKQFAKFRKDIPKGMANQALIRAGGSEAEILDVAVKLKADLIVMATHSKRSQPGQIGTTAGRVASMAPCPVLLVPVKEVRLPFFL